jgi:hypothetical protein
MTDTEIRSAVASQRLELVAILAELPAPRWDEPTLCAGRRLPAGRLGGEPGARFSVR